MPPRSPNPVQMIQGYVQRNEPLALPTHPPEIVNIQKSYPGATVTVLYRRPGVEEPEPAQIFERDGSPKDNPINLDADTAYYSFYAQPGRYDIEFSGGEIPLGQEFKLEDVAVESLVFNVRDYGAKGDGVTDDTQAIQAALDAMIAAHTVINGVGTLFFPNGRYMVSRLTEFDEYIFNLPSGIIVQGTAGPYTGGDTNNCQLILSSEDTAIFHIGTDRHKIVIRDLAMMSIALRGSIAIEAKETDDLHGTFTSGLEFDNLTIWGFEKGISIRGSGPALQWDITGVRVNHCVIAECRTAIYVDSQNCSFLKIMDTRIGSAKDAFGIYLFKVGTVVIDSLLGAGPVLPPVTPPQEPDRTLMADSFIYLTSVRATVTIINCECESYRQSIQVVGPGAVGNVSWPIVLLNCALGPEVLLNAQCDMVSVGSRFLPDTVKCGPLGDQVRIFSFGDVIIDQDKAENPNYDFGFNAISRVAARANRYRVDFGLPTRIGGQGGKPPKVLNNPLDHPAQNTALAVASLAANGTQVSLCNPAGDRLFNIRADADFIYFEDPRLPPPPHVPEDRPPVKLMKLDRNGNLTVKGNYLQDPNL